MDWQSSVTGMYQPHDDNNDDEEMQEEDNEDFYSNALGNTDDDTQPGAPKHEQEQEQDVGAGIHLARIN